MSERETVRSFWFGEPARDAEALKVKLDRWYRGGPDLDREIRARFAEDVERALRGELDAWASDPHGRIALILLLDQFTRSLFRGTAQSFAGDARAQELAIEALDAGLDRGLSLEERLFLHMPLLHAELVALQARGIEVMDRLVADAPEPLRPLYGAGAGQARKYHGVIARFGRFPHRNEAKGRASTPEEVEFLKDWNMKQPPAV